MGYKMLFFIFLYIILFVFYYRHCRYLKLFHYLLLASIIVGLLWGLHNWQLFHSLMIYLVLEATLCIIGLEWVMIIIGIIYHFVYLKTKIHNQMQLDMLLNCSTYMLAIPYYVPYRAKEDYNKFWVEYHQHSHDVGNLY